MSRALLRHIAVKNEPEDGGPRQRGHNITKRVVETKVNRPEDEFGAKRDGNCQFVELKVVRLGVLFDGKRCHREPVTDRNEDRQAIPGPVAFDKARQSAPVELGRVVNGQRICADEQVEEEVAEASEEVDAELLGEYLYDIGVRLRIHADHFD